MLFYTSKDCSNSNQEIDLQKITSGINAYKFEEEKTEETKEYEEEKVIYKHKEGGGAMASFHCRLLRLLFYGLFIFFKLCHSRILFFFFPFCSETS